MLTKESLRALISERKQELFDLLSGLIQIDSQSFGSHGNEAACAERVAKFCREMGLETEVYAPSDVPGLTESPDYWPGRHLENRYNVTVRYPGRSGRDGLMYMGHSDTVEIGDRSVWNFEPLSGEQKDGKILGRGACDDKYALAAVLFILKLLRENGAELKDNFLFTAYSDEEHGGSHGALAACVKYPVEHIVNLDCKEFLIWHCASGGSNVKLKYHVKDTVDSAGPAARALPKIMDELDAFAARRRAELEKNPFYAGTIIPKTSMRYINVTAGESTDYGKGEILFVFYTDRSKEKIDAEFAEILERLRAREDLKYINFEGFEQTVRFFHYGWAEPEGEDIRAMCRAAEETSGRKLQVCGSCLSDLSVILKYGTRNAYGFGIGRDFNAPGGAHQPNEFIECGKLVEYTQILATYLLDRLGD